MVSGKAATGMNGAASCNIRAIVMAVQITTSGTTTATTYHDLGRAKRRNNRPRSRRTPERPLKSRAVSKATIVGDQTVTSTKIQNALVLPDCAAFRSNRSATHETTYVMTTNVATGAQQCLAGFTCFTFHVR